MLNNLAGWHVLILVGGLAVTAAVAVAIVFVAIRIARRK
jgi:hypothetical protein